MECLVFSKDEDKYKIENYRVNGDNADKMPRYDCHSKVSYGTSIMVDGMSIYFKLILVLIYCSQGCSTETLKKIQI